MLLVGTWLHEAEGGYAKVSELVVVLDGRQFEKSCERGREGVCVCGLWLVRGSGSR